MIRIARPSTPPAVLTSKGTATADLHCTDHDANPDDYRTAARAFTFTETIYRAEEVKDALKTTQHSKCAFCESSFDHVAYGDIEHFRPKGGYKRNAAEKGLRYPGYFWLAYEWSNLFYSCQLCNQQFKKNVFPVRDNRSRAHPKTRNIANEEPLLIDPATQDPATFIGFRDEYAFAVSGCPEGETTIEALGLNRDKLVEHRAERLESIRAIVELCALLRADPAKLAELQDWEAKLEAKKRDTAEYAAMARAFLGP